MKKLGFDLILLGDTTAGKDTQAAILRQQYALKPVESGKRWREMVKINNFDGRWLKRTFGKGHPAPVAIVKKFLVEQVKKALTNKNLIFIGNPRLKPEAQLLVKLLNRKRRDFFVFYLKLPEKEIFIRAKKRGARTQGDSQDQVIKNRIKYTKEQVGKTVKYFQSLQKLKLINGRQTIKKVSQDIQKAINDYQRS